MLDLNILINAQNLNILLPFLDVSIILLEKNEKLFKF
tara:strand:- start:116 stop:226 length:111 start_codon:yes stop_codon:yes gene_type:complete